MRLIEEARKEKPLSKEEFLSKAKKRQCQFFCENVERELYFYI